MNCEKCGSEIKEGKRFCTVCGAPVGGPSGPPPAAFNYAAPQPRQGVPAPPAQPLRRGSTEEGTQFAAGIPAVPAIQPLRRGNPVEEGQFAGGIPAPPPAQSAWDSGAAGVPPPPPPAPREVVFLPPDGAQLHDRPADAEELGVPVPPSALEHLFPEIVNEPEPARRRPPMALIIVAAVAFTALALVYVFTHLSAGTLKPVSGTYSDTGNKYSITLPPENWFRNTELESLNTEYAAVFQRGKSQPPEVIFRIANSVLPTRTPQDVTDEQLMSREKSFAERAALLIGNEYLYEHKSMTPYMLGGRNGALLTGTAKRGGVTLRIYFFMAMKNTMSFDFIVLTNEKDGDKYLPEIKSIMDSFKFN